MEELGNVPATFSETDQEYKIGEVKAKPKVFKYASGPFYYHGSN